jgi:hypothetical protein
MFYDAKSKYERVASAIKDAGRIERRSLEQQGFGELQTTLDKLLENKAIVIERLQKKVWYLWGEAIRHNFPDAQHFLRYVVDYSRDHPDLEWSGRTATCLFCKVGQVGLRERQDIILTTSRPEMHFSIPVDLFDKTTTKDLVGKRAEDLLTEFNLNHGPEQTPNH